MIGTWHIRHHGRFYLAAVAGLAVWLAAHAMRWPVPTVIGGDAFFAIYLAVMTRFALRATPEGLRRRASVEDEGIVLIIVLALAAIVFSLAAIFGLLNRDGEPDTVALSLAIASVPLGWLVLHTIAAFHYAHLFYAASDTDEPQSERADPRDAGGLNFPGDEAPGSWDFLYFSFVIGMTAQVSDVTVQTAGMRRLVLLHGVVSFFYNTVLLALAVNVAVTLAR
ncbi:MAG TPA: DUF1345 domain-containing protein [Dongiaceae bacterium]|jgi:uncharacterized membrane protein|nr:DUF1345 domain-containing protein [Dongiaceae bacterium]